MLLSAAIGSFPTHASAADEKMEEDQLVGRRGWPSIAWLIDVNAKENLA
jgi:hypothetical protein